MLTIEPLAPSNTAAFGFVHAAAWHETYAGILPGDYLARITPESRAARFSSEAGWSPETFLLARVSGKAAGILILSQTGGEGEVQALYLLRAFQGRGLGRQLMETAETRLRALGCNRVVLWVLERNTRARAFYAHMGFAPDGGRQQVRLGAPVWILRYAKTFSP